MNTTTLSFVGKTLAGLLYKLFTTLTSKLIFLKIYSQAFGSEAAEELAASDPTISAYARTIVAGLNSDSFETAIIAALEVEGITEDDAVAKAENAIETAIEAIGQKVGLNSTIEALIIAIAEPEIEAKLRAEYEALTAVKSAVATSTMVSAPVVASEPVIETPVSATASPVVETGIATPTVEVAAPDESAVATPTVDVSSTSNEAIAA